MNIQKHLIAAILLFSYSGNMAVCIAQEPGAVAISQSPSGTAGWSAKIEIEPTEEDKSNGNTAASGWDSQKAAASTSKVIKYSYAGGLGAGFSVDGQMYRRSIDQLWKWLVRTAYENVLSMSFEELQKMLPEELLKEVMKKTSYKKTLSMSLSDLIKILPPETQRAVMESTTYEKLLGMSLMEFFSVLYETDCWVSLNEFARYKVRRKQAEEASKGHGSLDDYGPKSKEDK